MEFLSSEKNIVSMKAASINCTAFEPDSACRIHGIVVNLDGFTGATCPVPGVGWGVKLRYTTPNRIDTQHRLSQSWYLFFLCLLLRIPISIAPNYSRVRKLFFTLLPIELLDHMLFGPRRRKKQRKEVRKVIPIYTHSLLQTCTSSKCALIRGC